MVKNNLNRALFALLLITACTAERASAQTVIAGASSPTNDTIADEISATKAAVEATPDSPKTHYAYIRAMGLKNPRLADQYRTWMAKYPDKVVFPLTIGTEYYDSEMPQATDFLLKAVEMAPKDAEIWSMLSVDAMRWGKKDASNEYMHKATLADPSNADYAANYLLFFQDRDPGYKQKVFDFVKRFPDSERGAQVLYWLAERDNDLNERISYFEQLRQLYPPQKFKWSGYGMEPLADAYLQTDPEKALTLINEVSDDKDMQQRKPIAEALIRIKKLEQDKNYKDAVTDINQLKLPLYNEMGDFIDLKKADLLAKTGQFKAAYDSLAVKFAKTPTDKLDTALELYGLKLSKDKSQVEQDIQNLRYAKAVTAYPFSLDRYSGEGKLNLSDLKGKVVLLTFWFPGCGPCRGEFPHFQAVMDKFKGQDVVYIGINVLPEQDPYVLPFMQNTKYSFIPLHGSSDWAAKNYHVRGEPTNFLIDEDGKIVFKHFRIDGSNHRTLELMISSLLKKGA